MAKSSAPRRIILDTDLGTDIDDALALVYAMRQPALRLEAVTTVSGCAVLRAHMAKKLLRLGGMGDVPVYAGLDRPLLNAPEPYLTGKEGEGLLVPGEDVPFDGRRAPVAIADRVLAEPGQIDLVSVGPMTNIAAALILEPGVAHAARSMTVMGGHVWPGAASRVHGAVEHNVRSDPEAAARVLGAGWDVTQMPLEITCRVTVDDADRARMRAAGTPLLEALVAMLDIWLGLIGSRRTPIHDPLALMALHEPSLFERVEAPLRVLYGGGPLSGLTCANLSDVHAPRVDLIVDVDVDAARQRFFETIL